MKVWVVTMEDGGEASIIRGVYDDIDAAKARAKVVAAEYPQFCGATVFETEIGMPLEWDSRAEIDW
jgi:hypothetical protein